jgi:hypothetical protein
MNNFVIHSNPFMNKLICIILFLALISCKTEKDAEGSSEDSVDTTAFQQKLKFEDQNLALEPQAREYALNWAEYIIAQNEVNKLHNSTLNEVMNNAGAIAQIMQSLKNSVPDSLRGVAVEARLNVINTKAQLLKQYSARQDPDAENIRETTAELHQEFNNFKLQMNEVFLKTLEEFEKELDEFERMEREMDSL